MWSKVLTPNLRWLVGTKHFPDSKNTSQIPKTRPRIQNTSQNPKTRPRIQKHVPKHEGDMANGFKHQAA